MALAQCAWAPQTHSTRATARRTHLLIFTCDMARAHAAGQEQGHGMRDKHGTAGMCTPRSAAHTRSGLVLRNTGDQHGEESRELARCSVKQRAGKARRGQRRGMGVRVRQGRALMRAGGDKDLARQSGDNTESSRCKRSLTSERQRASAMKRC